MNMYSKHLYSWSDVDISVSTSRSIVIAAATNICWTCSYKQGGVFPTLTHVGYMVQYVDMVTGGSTIFSLLLG